MRIGKTDRTPMRASRKVREKHTDTNADRIARDERKHFGSLHLSHFARFTRIECNKNRINIFTPNSVKNESVHREK